MLLIKGGTVILSGADSGRVMDILIKDGKVVEISGNISEISRMTVIDATGFIVAPGLVDIHVHFREPGFEYKEDILSGAEAAAAGGVTTCCCMPNTSPVADGKEITEYIVGRAGKAAVKVLPIGAVTFGQKGEKLTDINALKMAGAVALSDDGLPIVSDDVMRKALLAGRVADMLIVSHCEDEEPMVERDVRLAAETGTSVHIAHVSTAASVDTIRKAKKAGVKVTAEACPHHFTLTEAMVTEKGTNAKMSPPLRTERDVQAVVQGLCDGAIDAIVTDHAPHSVEEKALPYEKAPNGIIGLETSLAVTLTYLYHSGKLGLSEIIDLMSTKPANLFGLDAGKIRVGSNADIVIFDPNEEWTVDPSEFKSKSRNTPYTGMKLRGKVKYTMVNGDVVFES